MLGRTRLFASLSLAAIFALPSFADEKLDKIEKDIVEANAKVKSYTATMTTEGDMMGMKMNQETKMESMHKDGKQRVRAESKGSMDMNGQKMETTSLMVTDGEHTYSYSEAMGQKSAQKMKYDPKQAGDAKMMFETLNKDYELKPLDDAKVGDVDTYTIEATPKNAAASPMAPAKQVMSFCKKTGLMVKMVSSDKEGKPMMTMTMSDLKLNADIKPDRFKFEVPEGVTVQDMTNMGAAPAAEPTEKP